MISKTYKQFMANHEIQEGSNLQCTHTKIAGSRAPNIHSIWGFGMSQTSQPFHFLKP